MARLGAVSGGDDGDGLGGIPPLEPGGWPTCRNERFTGSGEPEPCPRLGQPLTHFFHLRLATGPYPAGTTLSVYQCVGCGDAVIPVTGPPYPLAPAFWDATGDDQGWWVATLCPPDAPRAAAAETLIAPAKLGPTDAKQALLTAPDLPRTPEHRCGCGRVMVPLVALTAEVPFATTPGAPEQRGTYSSKRYHLFLGNRAVLLGCPGPCHPRAVAAWCS